ncbi:MAG TPA: histidine kinase dimerization/phospho-acceptor domain-containing protein, partial [Chitinivibrionales bacterium]
MSVRLKLTIIFLAIASIPLIFVTSLTYTNFKKSLEANRLAQLRDLSVFRADRIEAYFSGLRADMEIAQGFYIIKKNFSIFNRSAGKKNSPEAAAYKKALGAQLKHMQSVSDMTDIMLVDPSGMVKYSNRPEHYSKIFLSGPEAERTAFEHGKTSVYFSDMYLDKAEDNRYEMLISAPATDFNGAFKGVIVFEVDMTPVYKLIQDVTGLGASGEVLVGMKIGNQAVFLNPLRHDPKAALTRKAALGDKTSFPIQQAVQGITGFGLAIDYRGEQVIAAWRYIPSMHWGLVAKIDTREAFADVTNLRNLAFMILFIVLALSAIMAMSIAQSISQPIQALSKGAEIIGAGKLDHKVGTATKDEIGQLSRAFDKMTYNLKTVTASRDELNKEIAERKKAQEALRESADDLARSNKDLEQFAYVASHDLQEPLRAVAGFMGLLKKQYEPKLDAEAREYIDFAVEGAERMQTLIHDLLAFSRVGTRGGAFEPIALNACVDAALINLRAAIDESGARIIRGDLPVVHADASQMTQLMQNLIGNAIKFRGQATAEVRIDALRRDHAWEISVGDNGIGI